MMITLQQNTTQLKKNIKKTIDHLDGDEARKVSSYLAKIAAKKATKIANKAWDENNITRQKIDDAVKKLRASKRNN